MSLIRIVLLLAGLFAFGAFLSLEAPKLSEFGNILGLKVDEIDIVYECPFEDRIAICGYDLESSREVVLYSDPEGNVTHPQVNESSTLLARCKWKVSGSSTSNLSQHCGIDLKTSDRSDYDPLFPGINSAVAMNNSGDIVVSCKPYDDLAVGDSFDGICIAGDGIKQGPKLGPDGYNNLSPQISDNGTVVFICEDLFAFRWEPYRHLCSINIDGTGFREITPTSLHVGGFQMNVDGDVLMYCSEHDDLPEEFSRVPSDALTICLTDSSGSYLERIKLPFRKAGLPTLGPNGLIAYMCEDPELVLKFTNAICLTSSAGTDVQMLQLGVAVPYGKINLRSDGLIVFGCRINNTERFNEVCTIQSDGTGFRQLTFDNSVQRNPDLR